MTDVTRLASSPGDEDSWWAGDDAAPEAADERTYTPQAGEAAIERLADALRALDSATNEADSTVMDAAQWMSDHLEVADLVSTVVLLQDLRRRLALVESYVARQAGHLAVEVDAHREGVLPDGRRWTLKRGTTRKAWDHPGWKRDARAAVVRRAAERYRLRHLDTEVVDVETGELADLLAVLQTTVADAQEVHGSGAPRVTQLRALGIDPDDYCQTTPGPWGVLAVEPSDQPNTQP